MFLEIPLNLLSMTIPITTHCYRQKQFDILNAILFMHSYLYILLRTRTFDQGKGERLTIVFSHVRD